MLKSLLAGDDPALRRLYIGQLVVLTDAGAELRDPDRRDADEVCHFGDLRGRLADRATVPGGFDAQGGLGRDPRLVATLTGRAWAPAGDRPFGN